MKRSLNLKFIAVLFVGFAVIGVCVHFLHAFQVKRNASSLLVHATMAEEQGDLPKSIFYLRRYLGFEPSNIQAMLKLGLLSADLADKLRSLKQGQEAYFILNRVLSLDNKIVEARRRVIDLALRMHRYADA